MGKLLIFLGTYHAGMWSPCTNLYTNHIENKRNSVMHKKSSKKTPHLISLIAYFPINFKPLLVWVADNQQQMHKRIDSLLRRLTRFRVFSTRFERRPFVWTKRLKRRNLVYRLGSESILLYICCFPINI